MSVCVCAHVCVLACVCVTGPLKISTENAVSQSETKETNKTLVDGKAKLLATMNIGANSPSYPI